jgi:hypothetical protein
VSISLVRKNRKLRALVLGERSHLQSAKNFGLHKLSVQKLFGAQAFGILKFIKPG